VFEIEFTASALEDLGCFKKAEQNLILDNIEASLQHEPLAETRHRKPLRPNDLSAWELRVGNFRVFYDVNDEDKIVLIKAIGYKKHSALYIRDRSFEL
jgi:mRNA-degrading endonuclease RelE of RelBE toxin-antitoxin system